MKFRVGVKSKDVLLDEISKALLGTVGFYIFCSSHQSIKTRYKLLLVTFVIVFFFLFPLNLSVGSRKVVCEMMNQSWELSWKLTHVSFCLAVYAFRSHFMLTILWFFVVLQPKKKSFKGNNNI